MQRKSRIHKITKFGWIQSVLKVVLSNSWLRCAYRMDFLICIYIFLTKISQSLEVITWNKRQWRPYSKGFWETGVIACCSIKSRNLFGNSEHAVGVMCWLSLCSKKFRAKIAAFVSLGTHPNIAKFGTASWLKVRKIQFCGYVSVPLSAEIPTSLFH